ncbi:hypothetical protein FP026_02030 [Rhizobium tropici]|uniref:Uncharacterized protein n=1 Tax=Rhizobium tropici TaxID=398 RepID=A0A5B0WG47_RHITR|nr:hypothetical protein FP026_02030 [Rhizobium tropici]
MEHDAKKCERFSDDIMLYSSGSGADSDFRPNRPKIIRSGGPILIKWGRGHSNGHGLVRTSLEF